MRELQVVDAAELATAYAAARYAALLDGEPLLLQVGETAADLEAYWPAARYVFITAWNPASEPRSGTANQTADALLVTQLDEMGLARRPAWAEGPAGDWREPGWLLADVAPVTVARLALAFGQAAVLAWECGEPVRLRMMMARPGHADVSTWIDWQAGSDWVE